MKKIILLLSLILLLAAPAWGKTYCVRADGSAANLAASEVAGTSCADAAAAMSVANYISWKAGIVAGDTVLLSSRGGHLTRAANPVMAFPGSGEAGNTITVMGEPGNNAVIDSTGQATGFQATSIQYCVLQDVTIQNASSENLKLLTASTGVTIRRVTLANPGTINFQADSPTSLTVDTLTCTGGTNSISVSNSVNGNYSNLTASGHSGYGGYFYGASSSGNTINVLTVTGGTVPIFFANQANLTANTLTAKSGTNASYAGIYLNAVTGTLSGTNWVSGGDGLGNAGHGVWFNAVTATLAINGITSTYNGSTTSHFGIAFLASTLGAGSYIKNINSSYNSYNGLDLSSTSNLLVTADGRNTISYNGNGVSLNEDATAITVRYTDAFNNGSDGFDFFTNANGNIIEYCRAYNNGTIGEGSKGDGYSAHSGTSNNTIRYSLGYSNTLSCVANTGTSSGYFYNNTCYGNGTTTTEAHRRGGYWTDNTEGTWVVENNIFSENIPHEIWGTNKTAYSTITPDYNLFYHPADANVAKIGTVGGEMNWATYHASYEANSLYGDPLFVSATDFRLKSNSPAINAGVDVGLTTDYTGGKLAGKPDIGAYERRGKFF